MVHVCQVVLSHEVMSGVMETLPAILHALLDISIPLIEFVLTLVNLNTFDSKMIFCFVMVITPPTPPPDALLLKTLNIPTAHAYQVVLTHEETSGVMETFSAIPHALLGTSMALIKFVFVTVRLNTFDSKMISCIVMASQIQTMEQTTLTQPLDALISLTLNIPMVHAYQAVLTHEEMNGTMDRTSAILLALADFMTTWEMFVWTLVSLKKFVSRMISSIVMVSLTILMEQMVPIRLLDALTIGTSNILTAHAYQVVLSQEVMNGVMETLSAIPHALLDISIPLIEFVLTLVNLNTFDSKMIFCFVMVITPPTLPPDALLLMTLNIPMAHACQVVLTHEETSGVMETISAIPHALLDTLISWMTLASTLVNLNTFDSKMIFCIVMATIMAQIIPTQPLDALLFGTSNIPTAHVYQAVLSHELMNGVMETISAIPHALLDISIPLIEFVLTLVNLNTFDSKMIFCFVMVITPPTLPPDALLLTTSNILMAHAYQAVLIHEEMSGVMETISAIPHALLDTLRFWASLALIIVRLNISDLKMIFCIVMATIMAQIIPTQPPDVPTSMISSIPMAHAYQVVLSHELMSGVMETISAIPHALLDISIPLIEFVLTLVNLNTFDSKMIFCFVMVITPPTLPPDALLLMTLNIPTAHAYQVVLSHEVMSGVMETISALPHALLDTLMFWASLALIIVNLNISDLQMIFCIAMATIMAQIIPTQLQDALTIGNSSTPTDHAYQVAPILTEMSGMMAHISAILLVLTSTLISWMTLVLTLVNLNTFDSKTIFSTVMVTIMVQIVLIRRPDALTIGTSNILMAHACQVVLSHELMSGVMETLPAIPHALLDTLMFWASLALIIVNLNISDLKMIFCIVMATIMAQIIPTQLLDALPFSTLNILMAHVYQAVLTHEEMNGTMDRTSAIPLVL
jgi:hypothetical protein